MLLGDARHRHQGDERCIFQQETGFCGRGESFRGDVVFY
jgi:hypothetical protein